MVDNNPDNDTDNIFQSIRDSLPKNAMEGYDLLSVQGRFDSIAAEVAAFSCGPALTEIDGGDALFGILNSSEPLIHSLRSLVQVAISQGNLGPDYPQHWGIEHETYLWGLLRALLAYHLLLGVSEKELSMLDKHPELRERLRTMAIHPLEVDK